MLKKEDVNRYNTTSVRIPTDRGEKELSQTAGATARSVGGMVWKAVKTLLFIAVLTGLLVFISVAVFIMSFKDTSSPELSVYTLNQSSTVLVTNASTGTEYEYMTMHGNENREIVEYSQIPQHMINAIVSVEDKRFFQHNGVDWIRTGGAVLNLVGGSGSYGGSTLTQQLIKNVTQDNSVSILRKVREIFAALNCEKKYTKEEILHAYLNIVSFGPGINGVQAAAKAYFDKNIWDCSIAECACIAGITQNPYQFDPRTFPEENKSRREDVLWAMYSNEDPEHSITEDEYNAAMLESDNMVFFDGTHEEEEDQNFADSTVWNWYDETMLSDVAGDLSELYGIPFEEAFSLLYTGGYEIHSAMNLTMQEGLETLFENPENQPPDENENFTMFFMDYSGKVLGVIGSRFEKTGNRVSNFATSAYRSPGSSIKPLAVYTPAMELNAISYGSVLLDQPIPEASSGGNWPQNFTPVYTGAMNVDTAIEMSQNAPAAQLAKIITPEVCYDFLKDKLQFQYLDEEGDRNSLSLSIGGFTYGTNVREMAAGYQIFGNGGVYHRPYTYFYVKDHDGNVILDNRESDGEQVISLETATVMNKLLQRPVYGSIGTANGYVNIDDVTVFGKTGTTDSFWDLWFAGGTPFAVGAIWKGYNTPDAMSDETTHKYMWRTAMVYLMENFDFSNSTEYVLSDQVGRYTFCRSSGLLAGGNCYDTATGWYASGNLPRTCNGGSDHIKWNKLPASVEPEPSIDPSASPDASASIDPSASLNPSVSPGAPHGSSSGTSSGGYLSESSSDDSSSEDSGEEPPYSESSEEETVTSVPEEEPPTSDSIYE